MSKSAYIVVGISFHVLTESDESMQAFPYVHRAVTRHGRVAYYFWRRPGRKIRMPDEFGSRAFLKAYRECMAGDTTPKVASKALVLETRIRRAVERSLSSAKTRARKAGKTYDLDFEWAVKKLEAEDYRCELTGIKFFSKKGDGNRVHPFTPSLDRISAGGGYTKNNVRIVIFAINVMLHDWGPTVLETVFDAYAKQRRIYSGDRIIRISDLDPTLGIDDLTRGQIEARV